MEEKIVSAEKNYKANLDYGLNYQNAAKYLNKILNYETKIKKNIL